MKQYHDILNHIKENGCYKPAARENMPGTKSIFGYQFRHNLAEGFPLITTKKVSFKNVVVELLWFLSGNTNVKFLIDKGCNIWNEDAFNYYKKICSMMEEPEINILIEDIAESRLRKLTFEEFVFIIKNNSLESLGSKFNYVEQNYVLGSCGHQYGKLWREWGSRSFLEGSTDGTHGAYILYEKIDQLKELINGLNNNPLSRRHIISAWQPDHLNDMALNVCHALVQFNCRPIPYNIKLELAKRNSNIEMENLCITEAAFGNKDFGLVPQYYLDCQMYQRSADVFLGVPYNIASYALLTEILAKVCNMIPGEFVHTFGDVHIYENHLEQVDEQLKRECRELPALNINTEFWNKNPDTGEITADNFLSSLNNEDFINCLIEEDIQLSNYNPHPAIKAKLSTGLK